MPARPSSFLKDQSGAALTEMLIVLPVIMLLIVGTFHLSYYVAFYHGVEKAARTGARYLARVPQQSVDDGWVGTNLGRLMITGTTDDDGTPLLPGWEAADAATTIVYSWTPADIPDLPDRLQTVTVTANVPLEIPVLAAFGFGDAITLSATHEERHVGE